MIKPVKNLVFGGAGILGIAYLGALDYLYKNNLMMNIEKVAGTSSGAITSCIASFNLPFEKITEISNSLDYKKILEKKQHTGLKLVSLEKKKELKSIFGDVDCVLRLVNDFGWYSSSFLYKWLKNQIAAQFKKELKSPPYTFADFKNTDIHIDNRQFYDLYIIATDISNHKSKVFSFETTPDMEVADAVRRSMSVPLFFEAVKTNPEVFSDGAVMRNYPISIFDRVPSDENEDGINFETLGITFKRNENYSEIKNILDFIKSLIQSFLNTQQDDLINDPTEFSRSIFIEVSNVSFLDFNISVNDEKYNYLYEQGYKAAEEFFK